MKKRLLSIILAVVMLVGIFPIGASAIYFHNAFDDDWKKEGDWYFTIYNGEALACAYVGDDTEIIIPSSYKGRDVTYYNYDLLKDGTAAKVTSIYFPSTIYGFFTYNERDYGEDGTDKYYSLHENKFDINNYDALKNIDISDGNPFFKDESNAVLSKDGKTLWHILYNSGTSFSTSDYDSVTEIKGLKSKSIKNLTIGKNIKKIDTDGIFCLDLENLYITTKTDDITWRSGDSYIPTDATIYCYKSSGAYEYFTERNANLKKAGMDIYKIVTEPKKPQKPVIESIKYGRYARDNGDIKLYCVKITVKDTGADGYKVYRYNSKTKKYKYLGKVGNGYGSMVYVDKTAKPGKTYKYKVMAYDKENKLTTNSSKSKAKSITTPKLKKPGKVKVVSTKRGKDYVYFSIEKKVGSGYKLYRWNSSKKKYEEVTEENRLYCHDYNAKSGKTYTYKLRAYKKASTGEIVYGPFTDKIKVKG